MKVMQTGVLRLWLAFALAGLLVAGGMAFGFDGDADIAEVKDDADILEKRNRLLEIVSQKGADAIPELQEAVNSEDGTVRYTAAWLLANLGEPAREALRKSLEHEDVQVRYIIFTGLEDTGNVGEYAVQLMMNEDPKIRRRFFLDTMPQHLLTDGEPTDGLIENLDSAYDDAPERIRYEIIKAVADLPLTASSRALLGRAADQDRAVVAAEGDESDIGPTEEKALIAFRRLLERDIKTLRQFVEKEDWQGLVDEFGERDISAWPNTRGRGRRVGGFFANEPAEASYFLGKAYVELGRGEQAEEILGGLIESEDVSLGVAHHRERAFYTRVLDLYRENYETHLQDNQRARDRYVRMRLDYGNRLLRGRHPKRRDALASYQRALRVEGIDPELKEKVQKAMEKLDES